MSGTSLRFRALASTIAAASVALASWMFAALPAQAAPAPVIQPGPQTITADALPTAQLNGVVWSQAVVGNTVYAGGNFSQARPAGAPAGTNQTPRNNLMAYDITTGVMTSFNPNLNGQVLSVAASPDGSRVYAVGDFSTVAGTTPRRRVAAFSTATGALITSFAPVGVDAQAKAVTATNDAVYVGGSFGSAGGTPRRNLAAFRASDGALLPWNPDADFRVAALVAASDGSSIIVGGSFQNVGGQPAYGLAKVSATGTGAIDTSWQAANTVRNAGPDAGITSLRVQGDFVYGTTYHFGPGGNLEGTFKAPVSTGVVEWVTDCHGDAYSSFVNSGVVYVASHAHYCGNMGGGHPQYPNWRFLRGQAWTDTVGGDILNDVFGYPNWAGVKPGPSMVNWLPDLTAGSFTGQSQAAWNVAGNDDYVVFGGEFPSVNGTAQQGLVRFGKRPVAPAKQGPRFTNNTVTPTLVPTSPDSLRVTWPAGFDRDNYTLNYRVVRDGAFGAPRYTTTANSNWWTLPALGFVDTGLTPGASYRYQIVVSDPDGNTVYGGSATITMPTSVAASTPYADAVRAAGARIYWPLNEASGTVITDRAATASSPAGVGITDARSGSAATTGRGAPGAIEGDAAATFDGSDQSWAYALGTETAPDTFSSQVWIKTGTTGGGRILGFGDLQTGGSGHRDRQVYMDNSGRIIFGVRGQDNSIRNVASARSYNDNAWHMITATMGPDGMSLYVDGVRVGRRSDTTAGEAYLGYWRLGADNLDSWPSRPANLSLNGALDEVAIYPTVLTQEQINAQYQASGRTSVVPPAPADAYGAAVYADEPDLFWRFAETGGSKAADSGKLLNDGTYRNGVALGASGVVSGNAAAQFNGSNSFVSSDGAFSNPTVYSQEAWFKTTSTRGGKVIGFGNSQDGTSGNYDRHVYLQDDGRLVFGTWTGQMNLITSPGAYNDGGWHHVVATQSADGMKLYVDGVLVGTNPQTQAQPYDGYWRVGGDQTWGSSSNYLDGVIDEAAVYSYELPAERVNAHYIAGGGVPNQAPTAAFTSNVDQRRATFDGSGSGDADGSIVNYAWDFGDGTTGSGANPVHVFGESGSYTVKLTVTDNKGSVGEITRPVTVTAPPAPADAYGSAVSADRPRLYWRLGESSGTVAGDSSGALSEGTFFNGYTLGERGALPIPDTAARFDGGAGFLSSNESFANPTTYTQEAWFKTTTTRGGKLIGFGSSRTGNSNSYDRHVYMQDDGRLVFGTYTGQLNTITSPAAYNNGEWHQAVATQGPEGMKLYVDGELVGTNPQTRAEAYTGYWKVGGDSTWGSSSAYFDGTIDEVAVYEKALSAERVAAHYAAAAPAPNQKPAAAFEVTKADLDVSVDAAGSTDADGRVVDYRWDFGDGFSTAGQTATHTYAAGGTYTITLTVTDDDGETDTATREVSVAAANVAPVASFTAAGDALDVALDAGASEDPDGTIESYAWDFGDGTSGTGKTVSHRYAEAGDYPVTLTVTDNRGGTAVATRTVSATKPPNQPPTAVFAATTDALRVDVDATASSDPDGTIASYAWDFGDGSTGTGRTADRTYAAAGTYQITLTVTDNDGRTATSTQSVAVEPGNQSPTAEFTSRASDLKVDFDAGGSADPDGSITSYGWDFGDGATGTGATPSHTYGTAGTYPVTLTVTDNDGATASIAKSVTVTAPANQPPTASFTSNPTDLTLAVDGSGSSDPDGDIAGYAWDFGDGTPGQSGRTASHAYAAAGTYAVTLTVTDNAGATGTKTASVTVTAPAVLAADAFDRTVTGGWGSAETGGPWTTSSTVSNFGVLNGSGTIRTTAAAGPAAYLNGVSAGSVDLTSSFGYDKPGTGGGTYTSFVVRRAGTSDYRVKVRVTATGTTLFLARTVNGSESTIATQNVSGLTYAVGDIWNIRLQAEGTGPTALRAKLWRDGTPEPGSWQITGTDSTAALQNPGAVGVWNYLSGSATNSPVTLRVGDFRVRPLP